MHRRLFRPLLVGCALALAPLAAACGSPDTVSPLPVRTAVAPGSGLPSAAPAASTTASPGAAPTQRGRPAGAPTAKRPPGRPATSPPGAPSSCHGAVRYDLDLHNTELALVTSMCFKAGGVLRLQGIGPGLVTVTPDTLTSSSYEAGVQDIRFVRRGTVDVRIPQDEQVYTITVVIA
jgi:hypothetical protein